MLKIQYKHESLIFFLLEEKQDHTVFSNIMQCSWTECLSIWSTFWIIQPFPICRVYICAIFPNSEGSCPIPKTLLWNASVRFRLFSALCWKYCLKKKKKKKKQLVVREMIPLVIVTHLIFLSYFKIFAISFTNKYKYHFARFSLQFWVTTPLKSMESCRFQN